MMMLVEAITRLTRVETGDELRDTRGAALLWLLLILNGLNILYGAVVLQSTPNVPVTLALLLIAQAMYAGMFLLARTGRVEASAFATGLLISCLLLLSIPTIGGSAVQLVTLYAPLILVGFCARPAHTWALVMFDILGLLLVLALAPQEKLADVSVLLFVVTIFGFLMIAVATTLNDRFQRALVQRLLALNATLEGERERAEQANMAKSLFLATMSHELRTPLSTIMGYTDIVCEAIEDDEMDGDQILSDLSFVKRAGGHLLGLIDDVLDLSRVESGQLTLTLTDIDLEELLGALAKEVEPAMRAQGNTLHLLDVDTQERSLQSDRRRVRQILLNLLSNAAKFTHEGDITLSVESTTMHLHGEDVDALCFHVRDTGIGLSPDDHQRIFERFEQADTSTTRAYGGSGLGLALSRTLAHTLEGDIRVESALGEGALFSLTLPVRMQERPHE